MNDEVVVSTFRTFLQMLGATLATLGIVQESQWPLFSGLIMSGGSLGWMLWARWNTRKVAANSIVIPQPVDVPAGDGSAQAPGGSPSGRHLSLLPIGLAAALSLFLGGCITQGQLETAADKAKATYDTVCAAYPGADALFQSVVAALPPGKVPKRVIEAEAGAVAALATLCAKTPTNWIEAAGAAAKAYSDAMRAITAARAAAAK